MFIWGVKRRAITIICIWLAAQTYEVGTTVIPVVVRRRNAIELASIDTSTRNLAFSRALVTDLEEKFAVSLVMSINESKLIYNEPWSRNRYDRIRILPFGSDANERPHEIRRQSGLAEEVITSLAFDWMTGNIYVAVEQTASLQNPTRVEVCRLLSSDGGDMDCAVVLHSGLEGLHSLVVDPIDGYMYWLNRMRGRIERAWMDGRHLDHEPYHDAPSPHIDGGTLSFGLTLDAVSRTLYYIRSTVSGSAGRVGGEAYEQEIVSCRLYDRAFCRVVVRTNGASVLAPFRNFLFWTTASGSISGAKSFNAPVIQYCAVDNCGEKIFLLENSRDVESLSLIDPSMQRARTNPNPCIVANGGCSHVCLLMPGAPWRQCACPVGIRLAHDGATCETTADGAPLNVLFVTSTGGLFYVSLDTDDRIVRAVVPSASGQQKNLPDHSSAVVNAVDFDPVTRHVYWLTKVGTMSAIRRCRLSGTDYSHILTDEAVDISSFAVDQRAGNLLWTDATNNRLEIMSLRTGRRRTLLSDRLLRPESLRIDDARRRVYFINYYSLGGSRLESVSMDGSQRTVLVELPVTASRLGESMAIVTEENAVYWFHKERRQILRSRLDGSPNITPEVVADGLRTTLNSITKLGSRLFYNTVGARFVTELQVDGRAADRPSSDFSDAEIYGQTSLRALRLADVGENSSCAADSCDHICVQTGAKARKCLCSDGFEPTAADSSNSDVDERICERPAEFLVVADADGIWRASTDGRSAHNQLEHFAGSSPAITAIGGQDASSNLYWSAVNQSSAVLFRADLEQRHTRVYLNSPALGNIVGAAVDSQLSSNLCDSIYRRLEVISSRDPKLRRSLYWSNVSTPNHLTIHSTRRALFFTVAHANTTVDICTLQYDAPELSRTTDSLPPLRTLVVDAGNVTALAVDTVGDRLFWTTFAASQDISYSGKLGTGTVLSMVISDSLFSSSPSLYSRADQNGVKVWFRTRRLVPTSISVSGGRTLYMLNNNGRDGRSTIGTLDISTPAPALPNSVSSARQTLQTLYSVSALGNRKLSHIYVVSTMRINENISKVLDCHDRTCLDCICMPQAAVDRPQCVCPDHMRRDERSGACRPYDDFLLLGTADRFVRFAVGELSSGRLNVAGAPSVIFTTGATTMDRPPAIAVNAISSHHSVYWIDDGGKLWHEVISTRKSNCGNLADSDAEQDRKLNAPDCTRFFDVHIDVLSRQLFASCTRRPADDFGFVHVWRIQDIPDEPAVLRYLGIVVDGSKPQHRILPKEIVVNADLGVLFYVDHNVRLNSSAIYRCRLDGRHCAFVASTGLPAGQRAILRAFGPRFLYLTDDGVWSRNVTTDDEPPHRATVQPLNDVRQHLTWETAADRRRIQDIVIVNESLALVVADSDPKDERSRVLELNLHPTTFKYTPRHLINLEDALLPLAAAGLDRGRLFAAAVSFGSRFRPDMAKRLSSSCSHITAPTPTMRRVALAKNKEQGQNKSANIALLSSAVESGSNSRNESECLCPYGFRISTMDPKECEPSVVCTEWEFSCADGRSCVHLAQRCDRYPDCPDGSDEHATTCPFYFSPDFASERADSNNATDHWMCDDGAMVIRKYLLCDGSADCGDVSDEAHCRCRAPTDTFDCAAWQYRHYVDRPLGLRDDCILRATLCDGRDNCRYGADERAQLCTTHSSPTFILPIMLRDHKLVLAGLAFAVLILFLMVCCLCVICTRWPKNKDRKRVPDGKRENRGATAPLMDDGAANGLEPMNQSLSTYYCVATNTIDQGQSANDKYARSIFSGQPYSTSLTATHRQSSRISQFSQSAPFCRCSRCVEMETALTPNPTLNSHQQQQRLCIRRSQHGRPLRENTYGSYNLHAATGSVGQPGFGPSRATTPCVLSSVVLPAPSDSCLFAQPNGAIISAPPPSAASESTYGVARIVPTSSVGLLSLTRHDHRRLPLATHNVISSTTTTSNSQSYSGGKRRRRKVRMPPRGRRQRIHLRLIRSKKAIVDTIDFIPSSSRNAQSTGGSSRRRSTPLCSTPIASEEEPNPTVNNFFGRRADGSDKLSPPPPSSIRSEIDRTSL